MSELEYLRRQCANDAGKILELDSQCVTLRQELERKRRAFALMAALTATQRQYDGLEEIFENVARRINAAIYMQRTAVLLPADGKFYKPSILQGYPEESVWTVKSRIIPCNDELLDIEHPVLVNGNDSDERLADFRSALGLKYFVSAPVALNGEIVAILVTGRMVEDTRFLQRLGIGDVETVQTVSAHLAALVARSRVKDAEERTKMMLDSTPMCCTIFDRNYKVLDCNGEAVRLFGASGADEYLEKFYDFSPEFQPNGCRSTELFKELIENTFEEGYARFEWIHRTAEGAPIPGEVTLVRLRHTEGYIVASYVRDLREQKAIMGAMFKKEDELRKARDHAEKNVQAKSEFIANMSHEIHTPLNAILGMCHILEGSGLNEDQAGYLRSSVKSANLLLKMMDDILDIAAADSGRMKIEPAEFSIRGVVNHVKELTTPEAAQKSLDVSFDVASDVPDILVGDALRIERVLLEIVGNSTKFTNDGYVRVSVSLTGISLSSVRLLFKIEDSGIGMTDEQAKNVFAPFYQADTSSTRRYGGAGLGLAVSKQIVELMGGELWYELNQSAGSKFTFEIPLSPRTATENSDGVKLDKDAGEAFEELAGMKVLLVEDNEMNQMIAEEILAEKGVVTDSVNNGVKALQRLNEGAFYDLVLMDIQMPEMDGITATLRIRENPMFKNLPIVALTAHGLPEDRETSLKSGMNEHLTKPIDPMLLYKTLKKFDLREKKV